MITLTEEQAQKIEEALAFAASHSEYLADDLILYGEALATIRAARAQEQEPQPVAWTYEEVKSAFEYLKLQVKGPDDKWTVGESCTYFGFFRHGIDAATQRRTAPVRTKDLTVSELDAIIEKYYDDEIDLKAMILDGIAADREKNK